MKEKITKIWQHLFLEERPSIGLSFFRIAVALTTGFHVLPSFFHLEDNYYSTALKRLDFHFFTPDAIELVQHSSDLTVLLFVFAFCITWFMFLIGLFSQMSCILMTFCCYYFYALNAFHIGTLSWDILLVTLFLMCISPYHGDYFSVDALRRGEHQAYKRKRPFFVQRLLQLQIAFTYFYTGAYKISNAGNWLIGNPIYYLMHEPPEGVTKYFLLREFLANHPQVCYWLGLIIVTIELLMPVMLFWRKTRISAIALGFIFQVTLLLTLDVPAIFFFLFPPQLLLFIHPDRIVYWIEQKRNYNRHALQAKLIYDGHCQFCQKSIATLKVTDLFECLEFVDYQKYSDLAQMHSHLTKRLAASQIHLLEPDGNLYGGFEALRRLCLILPMLYVLIPVVYFPGMGIVGPIVYKFVAKNRYFFHFGKVCKDNQCFR